MKLVDVAQSVSRRASPTGLKPSQQVRNEPACVSVMRGAEPGVVRVQAVRLNPEICIVVDRKDNLLTREKRKPTLWNGWKAAVPSYATASRRGHHRGLRVGHILIGVTSGTWESLLSPCNELPVCKGCRLTQESWRWRTFPCVNERI